MIELAHIFISPNDESAKEVIETASVVIIESYLPDDVRPNGRVIQLWHGTPIKRLFLDSKEPHQNLNIYNYRARKYNKWVHQDYLVVDSTEVVKYFESAFPSHKLDILPIGYPRVNYLLNKSQDLTLRKRIIKGLQLDTSKPVLLYAPTWKSNTSEEDILPLSDKLLNKYNVIFKGHVESKDNYIPDGVIVPPESVETQDLIMIADIVLTDYSSIIFDALTLNKKVCLYTPNHAQYVEERGVYEDVLNSLKEVWYTDAELLTNHLISDSIPHVNSKYINRQNHSLDKLSHLIAQQIH
ncbi:TagF domain protein (fragment) [Staphylococcus capitis]